MHLLCFKSRAAAERAFGEELEHVLPTSLVVSDAVWDKEGKLVQAREELKGFWVLAEVAEDSPEVVAMIMPSGVITRREDILGLRLDPVWSGMSSDPLSLAPEPDA